MLDAINARMQHVVNMGLQGKLVRSLMSAAEFPLALELALGKTTHSERTSGPGQKYSKSYEMGSQLLLWGCTTQKSIIMRLLWKV